MKALEIPINTRFGRLITIDEVRSVIQKNGKKLRLVSCRCDCGKVVDSRATSLIAGSKKSCGCLTCYEVPVGTRFGSLVTLENPVSVQCQRKDGRTIRLVKCLCDCGNIKDIVLYSLYDGMVKSCGCLPRGSGGTHNMCGTRIYETWQNMKARCLNPKSTGYYLYGGKGIRVCEHWLIFDNFYRWAMDHGYEDSLTIDRIDTAGNYEPNNCRWSSRVVQNQNRGGGNTWCGKPCSSIYKGVSRSSKNGKWISYITIEDQRIHIGIFEDEVDAAKAYNERAQVLFGESAWLNLIPEGNNETASE